MSKANIATFPATRWLLRFIFSRRGLYAFIFFVTAIAALWQIENWRGRARWQGVEASILASGSSLDLRDYLPGPVPKEQNALYHPVFDTALRDESVHFMDPKPVFEAAVAGLPTKLIDYNKHTSPPPMDLQHWQQVLREEVADQWPNPSDSPANDVLWATRAYGTLSEGLDEAFKRPHAQWFHYDADNEVEPRVPQIANFVSQFYSLSRVAKIRALAHLENAEQDLARRDLITLFTFRSSLQNQPSIVPALIGAALDQELTESLSRLLRHHSWRPQDLLAFQESFALIRPLEHARYSFESGRAHVVHTFTAVAQGEAWAVKHMTDYGEVRPYGKFLNAVAKNCPKGWVYQNLCNLVEWEANDLINIYDPDKKRVAPEADTRGHKITSYHPYTFLILAYYGDIYGMFESFTKHQSRYDLLQLLCALERHRSEHQSYPSKLDTLVPTFLGTLPHDYKTGAPVAYEFISPTNYTLSTLDWKGTDEHLTSIRTADD